MSKLPDDAAARIFALMLLAGLLLVPTAVRGWRPRSPIAPSPTCGCAPLRVEEHLSCPKGALEVPDPVRGLWLGRRFDLNRVEADVLTIIPGIGDRLSARIIEDRAERGPFRSLEDVERVKGIGPALRRRLSRYAEVQTGAP